jgi:hypothetical protein
MSLAAAFGHHPSPWLLDLQYNTAYAILEDVT